MAISSEKNSQKEHLVMQLYVTQSVHDAFAKFFKFFMFSWAKEAIESVFEFWERDGPALTNN